MHPGGWFSEQPIAPFPLNRKTIDFTVFDGSLTDHRAARRKCYIIQRADGPLAHLQAVLGITRVSHLRQHAVPSRVYPKYSVRCGGCDSSRFFA